MYCSYRPPMMAFAIHQTKHSFGLFERAEECVLAVPGETLAWETMQCGTLSGRRVDKARSCDLEWCPSEMIGVPGIAQALANVELSIRQRHVTGDCLIVVGEVRRFARNSNRCERNLLSIGPDTAGYDLLERSGLHRLAVVAANPQQVDR